MKSLARIFIAVVVVACIGIGGGLAYIGYFGGQTFGRARPTAPASAARRDVAIVFLSGDMGINGGMGRPLVARFAADGIPAVTVNSLVFFRHERAPGEVRDMVATAIRKALDQTHARHLILIGQSFGADALHIGLAHLPDDLRARVALVVLVVPTDTVLYRATPSNLFNWFAPEAPALPTGRLLTWVPVVCVRGVEETDSLCPLLHQPNLRQIGLPGDHYLQRNPAAVHAALLAAIDRVLLTRRASPNPRRSAPISRSVDEGERHVA